MKNKTDRKALELLNAGPLTSYALAWLDKKVDGVFTATHTDGRTLRASNCYDLMVAGGWGLDAAKLAGWSVSYTSLGVTKALTPDEIMRAVYIEADEVNAKVERAEGLR